MVFSRTLRSRFARTFGASLVLAAVAHCGNSASSTFNGSQSLPCSTIYAGLCGGPCETDTDCANGIYCGADKKCTADCSPQHALCASDQQCSERGRCTAIVLPPPLGGDDDGGGSGLDGGDPDSVCADINLELAKILPKVVFLLDQSSSMIYSTYPEGQAGAPTRWDALKNVLIGPANAKGGLLKELEGDAEIALALYSGQSKDGDQSLLPAAGGPYDQVCPRFNGKRFAGLTFSSAPYAGGETLLRGASVDDDTPTGPAIRTVVGLQADGGATDAGFAAYPDTTPRVLVLVTDGEPGACADSQYSTVPSDQGKVQVVQAVTQTYGQKIRTFVIAIGSDAADAKSHFDEVANAGQGLDPKKGDAGAILPSAPEVLTSSLRQIVLDARTCEYDLNGQVEPGLEGLGVVTLNGTRLPLVDGTTVLDGWRLVNPSRLELVGTACKTLKESDNPVLTARFPCNAIKPGSVIVK